jgi:ABC-type oligopeptide transport system ATPase subunit
VLKLDRVTKVFQTGAFGGGTFPAVRQVSFEISPGEVTALIGESGSGKTTIGKMILRLERVTSGSIEFDGQDIGALKGKALKEYYRHVQGVFQDPFSSYNPVFRADRVFQMVKDGFFPEVDESTWSAKVTEAVEAVGLNPADVLNKFTHQLSGGQLQRLLIARALLLEIKLLVADEIISMLDASTRVDVLNLLAELKKKGLGILFITHDLSLGNYIAERTIILRRGVVLEMGATDRVFTNPQHPYTKMLLASVPQLHHKWGALTAEEAAASGVSTIAPSAITALHDGARTPSPRRVTPLQAMLHPSTTAPVHRIERFVQQRREVDRRAEEPVLQLVEVEPGHHVALPVGEPTRGDDERTSSR